MDKLRRGLAALALLLAGEARGWGQETGEAAGPPVLTLAEAVEQALAQNDRIAGSRDSLEQANLSLRLARSAFRPKVVPNILGSFGQTDVSNQTYRVDLTQRLTVGTELRATVGSATSRNQLGNFYSTDTTLQLSQPLLRGLGRGAARRSLTSAESRLADATRQQALSEQQVAVEVAGAYYRLVAQKRLVEVAEKSLERTRKLLEASEAKLAAGKVSQLDVFRAQQVVAQGDGQLLDAQAAVEDARDQLRFLMGKDVEYVFDVDKQIPRTAEEPLAPEEAVRLALERRLELRSAEDAVAEAERTASFAKNQLLPQLDVNLALTRRETADNFRDSFKFDRFRFATFFAVSLPTDRTSQEIEFNNALIERDRRRRDTQTLRLRIAEEARRVVRQQQRLLKSLEVAEASVEFAEREVEVANLRYQRGLSNNLDVVNAEESLLASQSRRIGILAELAVARLSMRATLGTLDPRTDVRGT